MDGLTFSVEGNRVILDNLDGLEETVRADVGTAMQRAAEVGKAYLETHTPVGTRDYTHDGEEHPGYLKSKNYVEVRDDQIVAGNDASYAAPVELGFHHYGSGTWVPAQPFLVPSALTMGDELKKQLEGLL